MDPREQTLLSMNRRQLLLRSGMGIGAAALGSLLDSDGHAGETSGSLGQLHFAPKAKRVIFLFQSGGPSQMDTWDHKPEMKRWAGRKLPDSVRQGQRITTMTAGQSELLIAPSDYRFQRHGQAGSWVSDLLPHTARVVDDLCVIRSVHTNAINHDPGITFFQTGHEFPGRPSMGAWLHYGLGTLNQDLPAFTVLISNGGYNQAQPIYSRLWGAGFLPTAHQGVRLRSGKTPVFYLHDGVSDDPTRNRGLLDTIEHLNRQQLARTGDAEIATRMAQYEMAHRMQFSVPRLTDLADEPEGTYELYGEDARRPGSYAANCLLARRLAERDVRFVQLYHTGWDHHTNMGRYMPVLCRETDRPTAGLIQDLKQRGLLDETLVIWAGEFGRTIYSQGALDDPARGRDHHPRCFTVWMAGGGVKPGISYGETDDFSYNIVANPVSVHDLQATLLRLLGVDHERLTYRFQGRRFRLTDIHGKVVNDIVA
jgi:hypothetical protein